MSTRAIFLPGLAIFLGALEPLGGQVGPPRPDDPPSITPNVYLDCSYCDYDYIKTEITFVNYVRDRDDADLHVLVTVASTGSGGSEYSLKFMGRGRLAGEDQILTYFAHRTDSEEEVRKGLAQTLKVGLVRYVANSPIARRLTIGLAAEEAKAAVATTDPWNAWVFSLSASGYLSAEKGYRFYSVGGGLTANRVTPNIKILTNSYSSYYQTRYEFEDQIITTASSSHYLNTLAVRSLNQHWSVGGALGLNTSTYSNIRFGAMLSPAIEFSALDYYKNTRRQLRFLYRINAIGVRYNEETLYLKIRETLWSQTLSTALDMKEKWGTANASLEGSHYFHDLSKFHLTSYASVSVKVYKGLSASIYAYAAVIHDQLSLPKFGASYEDVLLRRRQLATSYSYSISLGLTYTFGSIFSNVVNPRFGPGGFYSLVN